MEFKTTSARAKGFTLIELVMVIVILGVLAAVALPKFVDLSNEANLAAAQSIAGSITSASLANFAASKAGSPSAVKLSIGLVVNPAGRVATIMSPGWALPPQYSLSPAGSSGCTGAVETMTLRVISPGNTNPALAPEATVYCVY